MGAALPWVAVLVAVLAGWPRAAARLAAVAVAAQLAVWLVMSAEYWQLGLGAEALGVVGALALAIRPPARHAVRVLGRPAAVAAGALVLVLVLGEDWRTFLFWPNLDPEGRSLPLRLAYWLQQPLTSWASVHTALTLPFGGVLVALVARRVGLAASVRLAALVAPAVAVAVALPGLAGPASMVARLAVLVVVAAVVCALTVAAGAALTWAARLLRRPS